MVDEERWESGPEGRVYVVGGGDGGDGGGQARGERGGTGNRMSFATERLLELICLILIG